MCGGLVSAFFLRMGKRGGVFPYLNYHAGRIMVYIMIGISVAAVGAAVGRSSTFGEVQVVIMMIAGLVVMVIGFNMIEPLPWQLPFEKVPVKRLKKLYRKATGKGPVIGATMGGVLNGFIPCSLLYAVFIDAAATGSPASGGLLLASFGVGTLPAMLSVSFILGKTGPRLRGHIFKLAAVVLIIMGGRTLYYALNMWFQIRNGNTGVTCH